MPILKKQGADEPSAVVVQRGTPESTGLFGSITGGLSSFGSALTDAIPFVDDDGDAKSAIIKAKDGSAPTKVSVSGTHSAVEWEDPDERTAKLVIVGDGAIGKVRPSALLRRDGCVQTCLLSTVVDPDRDAIDWENPDCEHVSRLHH